MPTDQAKPKVRKQPLWLVYIAIVLAGLLLLADTYRFAGLDRWTARLGIALLYTAFSFFVGRGRAVGYVAAGIVWLAVVGTLFL